jgi:hypothetical protein
MMLKLDSQVYTMIRCFIASARTLLDGWRDARKEFQASEASIALFDKV